jgi:hypothetical protein
MGVVLNGHIYSEHLGYKILFRDWHSLHEDSLFNEPIDSELLKKFPQNIPNTTEQRPS